MRKINWFVACFCLMMLALPSAWSQNDKTIEYTCEVVQDAKGKVRINPNYDYLGKQFWKENIESHTFSTVTEAVSLLNRYNFKVKTDVSKKNGERVVTMSLMDSPYGSVDRVKRMLEIGDMLDKRGATTPNSSSHNEED